MASEQFFQSRIFLTFPCTQGSQQNPLLGTNFSSIHVVLHAFFGGPLPSFQEGFCVKEVLLGSTMCLF